LNPLAIIELIVKNLTDRIALGVLFLSVILLGVAYWLPGLLGPTAPWLHNHPIVFVLGILVPIVYLPTGPIVTRVHDRISQSEADNRRNHRLQNLTRGEKVLLEPYIREDYRSRRILHTDPLAKGLAEDGVLYIPDVVRDNLGHIAYNIQDWARLYLKKHPEILKDVPRLQKSGDS
jgi:hypothetical protein